MCLIGILFYVMRPIPWYEEYSINEDWSVIMKWDYRLMYSVNVWWYFTCWLYRKRFLVHRLVAMTYINNHNNLPIVMHLDNDRMNNHYSNLKWWTVDENNKYMWKLWRGVWFAKGKESWNKWMVWWDHHTSKSVVAIKNWIIYMRYDAITLVTKDGFHPPSVTKVCKWQLKSHWWFNWSYL